MARGISVKITGDSRSYERALKRASQSTERFAKNTRRALTGGGAKSILKAGGLGALFGGAGVVGLGIGAGVSSVKAASSFEATMQRIQGLAGQSARQVAQWSNDLIALGPAIGKTPQELAEALYFIASSGVPASKALNTLTVSAKAASAGLGETQVVADAVTSVMNAYAASGMTAAHATDVLVATVREGKGEADEFAGVIGNVAAFSSKLNVPFEAVGSALAAMTQLGTDPRTAATQLMALYAQLLKVSSPMQKKAEEWGFPSLFDELQSKIMKGDLLGVIKQLKSLDPAVIAGLFPNVRAIRAVFALAENGGTRVEGVFKRMRHTAGSSRAAFAAYANTSKHHMEQLSASIEALKIAFGQGLAPVVGRVAQQLAKKFADPAFVARVRELGKLIGQKLYTAFQVVGGWFVKHWPQIQTGFRLTGKILGGLIMIVRRFMIAVLTMYNGVLVAMSGILDVSSHLPGFLGGDKARGALDAVNKQREATRRQIEKLMRAEKGGSEGAKDGDVHVYIDGQKVAAVTQRRLQRKGKSNAGSRRGRHGGEALGIG